MQYEYNKDGIGGWLGLLLGIMGFMAIDLGHDFLTSLHFITTPGLPATLPMVAILQLIVIGVTIWAIYLVIKRRELFRFAFVLSVAALFLWSIGINHLYIVFNMPDSQRIEGLGNIVRAATYGIIWIPYVYRSKRLKNRLDILDVVAEVVEEEDGTDSRKEETA